MRSHLLPKFYLTLFVDPTSQGLPQREPFLWMWNHDTRAWKKRAPKKATLRSGYYELFEEEAGTGGELEKVLALIEDRAAHILREPLLSNRNLLREQRFSLAVFLKTLNARQPAEHEFTDEYLSEHARDRLRTELIRFAFDANARALHNASVEPDKRMSEAKARDLLNHLDEIEIHPHRGMSVAGPVIAAHETAMYFAAMRWRIVRATAPAYFLTSDQPMKFFLPSSQTFVMPGAYAWKEVEITCPLRADRAIVATMDPEALEYLDVPESVVQAINLRTMAFTENLFAPCVEFPGVQFLRGFPKDELSKHVLDSRMRESLKLRLT